LHADPVCVKGGDHAHSLGLSTTSASFCFDGQGCYAADLASGTLKATGPAGKDLPLLAPEPDAPKVTEGAADITVCHHDGSACKKLVAKNQIDPGINFTSAVNASGTLGAIAVLGGPIHIEVFDVASANHVATFALPHGGLCGYVSFAGETLDVMQVDCGDGTSGKEWLYTKRGKQIARVGGAAPFLTGGAPVHVTDDVWAFAPSDGSVIVLQDVVTGKVMKRISVGKADPNMWATLAGDSAHLVLVFGGARAGDIAVVDVATGKVTQFPAKRC
jgi:DNA-binding beta-propeller fold protein YncE